MPEYCESTVKEEELDEQLFDDHAVIPSISYEPAPPEDMGFFVSGYKKLENREQRKKEVEQAIEKITPTPPENAARHANWALNRFQPVKGATPMSLSMARVTKDF